MSYYFAWLSRLDGSSFVSTLCRDEIEYCKFKIIFLSVSMIRICTKTSFTFVLCCSCRPFPLPHEKCLCGTLFSHLRVTSFNLIDTSGSCGWMLQLPIYLFLLPFRFSSWILNVWTLYNHKPSSHIVVTLGSLCHDVTWMLSGLPETYLVTWS